MRCAMAAEDSDDAVKYMRGHLYNEQGGAEVEGPDIEFVDHVTGELRQLDSRLAALCAQRPATPRTSPRTVNAGPGRRRSPENLAQPGRAGRARGLRGGLAPASRGRASMTGAGPRCPPLPAARDQAGHRGRVPGQRWPRRPGPSFPPAGSVFCLTPRLFLCALPTWLRRPMFQVTHTEQQIQISLGTH